LVCGDVIFHQIAPSLRLTLRTSGHGAKGETYITRA
jgi:hypothetical protein